MIEKWTNEDRIVILSDGIFAIAITLLVLDIRIPNGLSQQNFNAALINTFLPKTIFYVVTFLIIARYWISHRHLFKIIDHIDNTFIWINLIFLALVAFFPAIANLIEEYNYIGAVILYAVILAGCGYSIMFLWAYALKKHMLTYHNISQRSVNIRIINTAIIPTALLCSLLLLFIPHIDPANAFFSWLCIPIILYVINRLHKKSETPQEKSDDTLLDN